MFYQTATIWSKEQDKVKVFDAPSERCEIYWCLPRWANVTVAHRDSIWTHVVTGHFSGYIKTKYLLFHEKRKCMLLKMIQMLSDYIDEEINDAIKYAKFAIEIKDEYPIVADSIMKISEEEMKHMAMLHSDVSAVIEDYRKKNGEPPESMKMLYDILHKKQIDHAAEAKAYQSMYKGG